MKVVTYRGYADALAATHPRTPWFLVEYQKKEDGAETLFRVCVRPNAQWRICRAFSLIGELSKRVSKNGSDEYNETPLGF